MLWHILQKEDYSTVLLNLSLAMLREVRLRQLLASNLQN
jgi:hypothetical protein